MSTETNRMSGLHGFEQRLDLGLKAGEENKGDIEETHTPSRRRGWSATKLLLDSVVSALLRATKFQAH